jgi:hypothetical protein
MSAVVTIDGEQPKPDERKYSDGPGRIVWATGQTFAEALEDARAFLDRYCDWGSASISMSYGPLTGWLYDVHAVMLMGHIERCEVTLSVGTYEDLVKE